jgi:hypothetical protein
MVAAFQILEMTDFVPVATSEMYAPGHPPQTPPACLSHVSKGRRTFSGFIPERI